MARAVLMSVTSLAQRELLRTAKGIWVSLGGISLPTTLRGELDRRLYDSTVRWAVALFFTCWRFSLFGGSRRDDEVEVWVPIFRNLGRRILADAGGADLLKNFDLPPSAIELVDASDSEDAKVQVKLITAVAERVLRTPEIESILESWLKDRRFLEVGRNLIQRFPEPGSERPPLWGTPPERELEEAAPPPAAISRADHSPSRSHRFDTADYSSRRRKS